MQSETKICQNCKLEFIIEPDDFAFYEMIKVPAPTWCPECRMIRRLIFRNERTLDKRKCDLCHKDIFSMYQPETSFLVYCHDCWWSDKWDPMTYGKDYDFSKPFFKQLYELMIATPTIALFDEKSVNSNYCNLVIEQKNCYLVTAGWPSEDCMYINRGDRNKNSLDLYICGRNEFCYDNVYCEDSYKLFYSHTSKYCNDCYFIYNSLVVTLEKFINDLSSKF